MPSKNPRLSVVLTPAVAATLAALSQATGDSASSLVRGILEQVEPALQRMLQLVIATKQAQGKIGEGARISMARVVDDLEDAMAVADARTGRVVRDLVAEVEGVKGRRRRPGFPLPPAEVQAYADTNGVRPAAPSDAGGSAARSAGRSRVLVSPTPVPVTRGSGTGKTPRKGVRRG